MIDYDDGYDSGNFLVLQLWDPNAILHGPRTSLTYKTLPDVPWDVADIYKEWRYAAIDVDCFWLAVFPDQWLVVQERYKYGIVKRVDGDGGSCGGGGEDTSLTGYTTDGYDPYDPALSPGAGGCGEGSGVIPTGGGGDTGGGGAVCGGSQEVVYDYVCIDVWNETTGTWQEWWCGVVAICP